MAVQRLGRSNRIESYINWGGPSTTKMDFMLPLPWHWPMHTTHQENPANFSQLAPIEPFIPIQLSREPQILRGYRVFRRMALVNPVTDTLSRSIFGIRAGFTDISKNALLTTIDDYWLKANSMAVQEESIGRRNRLRKDVLNTVNTPITV